MKWKNWIVILVTGLAVSLGSSGLSLAAEREDLMEMIRDVEIEMAAISEHAVKLDQMVQMPNMYTLASYRYEWTGIHDSFNEVGKLVPKLERAAEGSMEWKKEAINELTSLIAALKVQVETARDHVDAVPTVERLYARENYELRIDSIVHYAAHIDDVIEHIQSKTTQATPTS